MTGVEEQLRALVVAGDLEALREYVDGLGPEDRKAARAWTDAPHDFDSWPERAELGDLP